MSFTIQDNNPKPITIKKAKEEKAKVEKECKKLIKEKAKDEKEICQKKLDFKSQSLEAEKKTRKSKKIKQKKEEEKPIVEVQIETSSCHS